MGFGKIKAAGIGFAAAAAIGGAMYHYRSSCGVVSSSATLAFVHTASVKCKCKAFSWLLQLMLALASQTICFHVTACLLNSPGSQDVILLQPANLESSCELLQQRVLDLLEDVQRLQVGFLAT